MTVPTTKPIAVSWSTEDLYNILMRGIEPDLCTDTLPLLDVMYEGETSDQRKERMQWYSEAFRQFLERYEKFTAALHGEFRKIQTSLRSIAEGKSAAHDDDAVKNLEHLFQENS
ncbi:hypothetical protein FJZ27_04695 [Candidatus Peribacteria bacterium]|nr:hypothetical protein [Candidatus Peribacteria bacterium]